mgnify:CR=1 FL=1
MNTNSVGLIGVGLLGSALANRLIDSGIQIHGFDSNDKQLESLKQSGGLACNSPTEVVQNCNVLILSLPSSIVTITTGSGIRINAPSNLSGAQTDEQIVTLTWSDNSDNEEGFRIQRSLTNEIGRAHV